ncbi:LTA synthase family protein [Salirhabdus salicampi]|uniref:LTA synthase family protein n=1 Tax=Salirhabdus salicampi TaxID=476102 RepID=UPI0020C41C9F|nr:LTA synthase family protein [Salirhabdus salicampi]MCP8616857.1 LTA synthase family protein [Salirhabdus salicampi]
MLHRINKPLFLIAALLFGFKTYILYRFVFNLSIENPLQELILLINPFATALIIFTFAVWMKPERQKKFVKYTTLIGTIILYVNLAYYRNFTDFITLPTLLQFKNFGDLGASAAYLVKPGDIFLFLDIILVFYLAKKNENTIVSFKQKGKMAISALSLSILVANFVLAEIERPNLFLRSFDREYLVKNIGLFNYHIYDVVIHSKTKVQRVMADGSEIEEIEHYISENASSNEKSDLSGIAEGKNVIFITAESLQTFVLDKEVNGEPITPFLNKLIEESYYFENFYHQTNLGKTSDSEFITANSLYPLPNASVFFTHAQNEYNAMPKIIKEHGYTSAVFHGNNKSFWNRDVMYDALGFDHFFSERFYHVSEENKVGDWGLGDKSFFEQSIKYLENLPQPFYTNFITLTNHHPFTMDQKYASIDKLETNSRTLNGYVQTVRYMDEAIEQFFEQLKQAGLYEESIIVIAGDHYGISDYHNRAMGMFLEKDITPYDNVQLQRVPMIIHIPDHEETKTFDKIAGQVDLKPTILSLLGIEPEDDITFGTDLFTNDRKPYVAFRNGDFVTENYVFTNDTCYDRLTGEILEDTSGCDEYKDQVLLELEYSDRIIYGDLFRFYNFSDNEETNNDE